MITLFGTLIFLLCLFFSILFLIVLLEFMITNIKEYDEDNVKYYDMQILIVIIFILLWTLFYWYSHYFNY